MKKSDLKVGMIVELRNKRLYMIHEFNNRLVLINASGWMDLEDYKENLLFFKEGLDEYDIVTVHKPDKPYQLVNLHWYDIPIIWKRNELPKLTDDEHTILENLDLNIFYPWIARDKDGRLFLHKERPKKDEEESIWCSRDQMFFLPYSELFKFIKWKDTRPYLIRDLIDSKQNER